MTKTKLPFKMNKDGINYLTYANLSIVSEEIRSIIKENRNDFEPDTLNNLFEIVKLCEEADHKIKLVDKLVSNSIDEEEMNGKWEEYE